MLNKVEYILADKLKILAADRCSKKAKKMKKPNIAKKLWIKQVLSKTTFPDVCERILEKVMLSSVEVIETEFFTPAKRHKVPSRRLNQLTTLPVKSDNMYDAVKDNPTIDLRNLGERSDIKYKAKI